MKVGIYGQFNHEKTFTCLKFLIKSFKQNNIQFAFENTFLNTLQCKFPEEFKDYYTFDYLDDMYDFLFCIGGDGTVLQAITHVKNYDVPIIGINVGRLGFLTSILGKKSEIEFCVNQILTGNFQVSERALLSVKTSTPNKDVDEFQYALNEITVNRRETTSMITVKTKLNGEKLTDYWADGLIISTPTGSTGYSLSCGGPIIDPKSSNLVITPIAPHNLNARPLVIPDDMEISLKVLSREDHYLLSQDSRITSLPIDSKISIKKASFTVKLLLFKDNTFFKTLRKKLLWGEDSRNYSK